MIGLDAATSGIQEQIRELLADFYTDDSLIQSRDPTFLQFAFDKLASLFKCVGLVTNT